jgi:hypothetical protein|tara:strand:- start:523 stop:1137 length:615 start_codon:yes stop_codon:yes gene_type:complete
MKSLHNYIIKPIGDRYNNSVDVGDKKLILNTEIFNHQYVNRHAEVISVPLASNSDIQVGDTVIVHHNVFRRWHDVKGKERNSKSYYKEDMYFVAEDQIYAYKKIANWSRFRYSKWFALKGFCFIKPIKHDNVLFPNKEKPLVGIVKYSDGSVEVNDLVGFTPGSEYEFVIDNEKLYRVYSKFITIKYEYQGNEEEYNPSWAQSS